MESMASPAASAATDANATNANAICHASHGFARRARYAISNGHANANANANGYANANGHAAWDGHVGFQFPGEQYSANSRGP